MLLPLPDLVFVVLFREDQVRLYPRNTLLRIDQQLRDPLRVDSAILVQFVAAFLCNGLDPALHRNAVCPSQQIEGLFVPQIDSSLEPNIDVPLRDSFQQPPYVLPNPKNLVDEIDVIDAPD